MSDDLITRLRIAAAEHVRLGLHRTAALLNEAANRLERQACEINNLERAFTAVLKVAPPNVVAAAGFKQRIDITNPSQPTLPQ